MAELSQDELNQRAAGLVTPYGMGTRSYNRSSEKREMDRQRKLATESLKHIEYDAPLLCRCPQREYPHELSIHTLIRYEWQKRELRDKWPWSLMQSNQSEPSTERREV